MINTLRQLPFARLSKGNKRATDEWMRKPEQSMDGRGEREKEEERKCALKIQTWWRWMDASKESIGSDVSRAFCAFSSRHCCINVAGVPFISDVIDRHWMADDIYSSLSRPRISFYYYYYY